MTVGETDAVPFAPAGPLNEASPLAVQEAGLFVTVQVKVEGFPEAIVEGLAVNVIPGARASTVTVTDAFVVPLLFVHERP